MSLWRALLGEAPKRSFTVASRDGERCTVEGDNWMMAFGTAMRELAISEGIERLVCEVMPNGAVIVHDVAAGNRWVIQDVGADRPIAPLDAVASYQDHSLDAMPPDWSTENALAGLELDRDEDGGVRRRLVRTSEEDKILRGFGPLGPVGG